MWDLVTLTGDLQWTQWSTLDEIEPTFMDPFWSLFMTAAGRKRDAPEMEGRPADPVRSRVHVSRKTSPSALGYYYDPTPTPDKTMNFLLPTYTFNVFTAGLGYSLNGLVIDLGFEFLVRQGERRRLSPSGSSTRSMPIAQPGVYDMSIVVPNISISYKF